MGSARVLLGGFPPILVREHTIPQRFDLRSQVQDDQALLIHTAEGPPISIPIREW